MVTAVICLVAGAAVTGCTDGGAEKERPADQVLEESHETMNALKTVTIDASTTPTARSP
ncbi:MULTISPECIES: hypothetical protein [unclassified Streptomyces]|uniref:hypothetical protein n=1 Tax=Streptomyces TaxID=1883 RepID=UPI0001C1B158|nr:MULTISPECIES: hypothetical protein [unclassified Streptomyces]SCD53716.1 hypothetical protein GA0115235_103645 [Streptomyces sp. DpondAA-F4a]SCD67221.1 hypothetical protein GA0115239_105420 [Streptomyces sp. BpilaLS-43]SCL86278.1 hypothetical protein SAMN04883147_102667 [Streptomyces sp. DpondAA-F4]PZX35061.1 hypothetical protein K373_05048 [Streptomyces sp. DvalAA-21]RAJ41110.1 hypothetical protein K351_00562 [Streptomyces sp. DpondAA-E10]